VIKILLSDFFSRARHESQVQVYRRVFMFAFCEAGLRQPAGEAIESE
jgi:hypothetical protein